MDYLKVSLTHLNIRQSIVILLTKLITIDILISLILIVSYLLFIVGITILDFEFTNQILFLLTFISLGFFKTILSSFVVLQWLNEYYEITSDHIIHKKGIIFRKTEQYRISLIRRIDVQDTFFGELFNYATISVFDIRLNKLMDMVLIHNPNRYARILRELKPDIEIENERTALPFLPKNEEEENLND